MPEISRFYGIIVYMFFNDHNPPHFKVKYGEFEANIRISNGEILNGDLPISKLKLVRAWAEIHKDELQKMWDSKELNKIIDISIQEPFKIICTFSNGENRIFDLEKSLDKNKKYTNKVLSQDIFSKVKVGSLGEIYWKFCVYEFGVGDLVSFFKKIIN